MGTLITALGCGIGREEYDLAKLRYHRIIIMTDADIDGSHIRTLLLTFFYRQMQELIENNHIFIANTPLFKARKGKSERYLKDETELDAYFMESALDGARIVHGNGIDHAVIEDTELRDVAREQLLLGGIVKRLSRRILPEVLGAMMHAPLLDTNGSGATAQAGRVGGRACAATSGDRAGPGPLSAVRRRAARRRVRGLHRGDPPRCGVGTPLGNEFFRSIEYRDLVRLSGRLEAPLVNGAVHKGERRHEVVTVRDALEWLLADARRGTHVQRYKGLGR